MEEMMMTPSLIWNDFSPSGDLNESVVREYDEDGIVYSEAYFSAGAMPDGITRVYAIFARPQGDGPFPAILYCHNVGETIDRQVIKNFVGLGYAVLAYDYSGENELESRYTMYPKSLDFANFIRSGRKYLHVDTNAKDTVWYEWTVVARYAVRYLSEKSCVDRDKIGVVGFRRGGYFAWQLASFCPEIKAAVSLFEGGWTEYNEKFKYSADNEIVVDEERERWLAGIATQVYAKHVKSPILYLGGTNDRLGNCDRVSDTLVRLDKKNARYAFGVKLTNLITESMYQTMLKFFEMHLQGKEVRFPENPSLFLAEENGNMYAYVKANTEGLQTINIYYCNDCENPFTRCWCKAERILNENGKKDGVEYNYKAKLPVYQGDKILTAVAETDYAGLYLTSLVTTARLAGKQLDFFERPEQNLVFSGQENPSVFSVSTGEESLPDSEIKVSDRFVECKTGVFDIKGICANDYDLLMYRDCQAVYRTGSERILKADVYCDERKRLTVELIRDYLKESQTIYRFELEMLGGQLWQKIGLSLDSFKSDAGISPKSWNGVEAIRFSCDGKFLMSNMIWV